MAANSPAASYKYQFVGEPSQALKCLICLEVAEEPWQHGECGTLFCAKCLELHGKEKACPNCQKEKPGYFADRKSRQQVQALAVKCDNVKMNCVWVGTVGTLQEHMRACQFALVLCPKECKEDNRVRVFARKDVKEHLEKDCPNRDHTCEHCGMEGTYTVILKDHDPICCEKIVPCPNEGCHARMCRKQLQDHVKTHCKHTLIPCKYSAIGCTKKESKRREMVTHESDSEAHLLMALDAISILRERSLTLRNGEQMKLELTDFEQRKGRNEWVHSPSYYTSPRGYHMGLRVYANGNGRGKNSHVSVFAYVLKGRHDVKLRWPFVGKITFVLLNQLEDKNHYSETTIVERDHNLVLGNSRGFPTFIPHSELSHDPVKKTQYLMDDTLFLRVSVEENDGKSWLG